MTLFSDSFGSSPSNTVSGWSETEGGSSQAKISTSTARVGSPTTGQARLQQGASITKTVSALDYGNIKLEYYWRGDDDAESNDTLKVLWRKVGDAAFTEVNNHVLRCDQTGYPTCAWSSLVSASLTGADNTSIEIRLLGNANATNEEARVDDVRVTGEATTTTLTVTKIVINDNGGTETITDFPLFVDGNPVVSGAVNDVSPGTYSVSETGDADYNTTFSGDCDSNGEVTLSQGDNKTCIITNDDIPPTLTVVKIVINDNGGDKVAADFTLKIDDDIVTSGEANVVLIGEHTVSEINLSGYAASAWGGDCAADGTVSLALGENKICTITNDDIPARLTVTKIVVNDNGGTLEAGDFPLFVNGVGVTSGVEIPVSAGTHTVSENNEAGYIATFGGDCDVNGNITLALGEVKSCTITNDDISPLLTVNKTVTNDNGGTLGADDFQLFIDGSQVTNGAANPVGPGFHTVSETPVSGYVGTIGGQCDANGQVSLSLGESKLCTIANDDIPPTLTVIKTVINDNGGTLEVNDFSLFISDVGGVASGEIKTVNAGTYTVSENNQAGYSATIGGDCDANGNVSLAIGQSKVCTLTNDDIPARLTVTKIVINDNGGTLEVSDFPLFVNGVGVVSGQENLMSTGDYIVSENNQAGYSVTFGGDCDANGNVILALDETKSCTITNDDEPGELYGLKFEDMNGNGVQDEGESGLGDWAVYLDTNDNGELDEGEISTTTDEDGQYSFTDLTWGTYNVREVLEDGWAQIKPAEGKYAVDIGPNNLIGIELDFGNFRLVTIQGLKWDDTNGDGSRDEGEPGIGGWTMALGKVVTQESGDDEDEDSETIPIEIVALSLTGQDGGFAFSGVGPGHYKIFEEKRDGWRPTNPAPTIDLFFDVFTELSLSTPELRTDSFFDVFVELSGHDITTVGDKPIWFGNTMQTSVLGFKWSDLNANGVYDGDEPRINDWTMALGRVLEQSPEGVSRCSGESEPPLGEPIPIEIVALSLTGNGGQFSLPVNEPGHYKIFEEKRSDWRNTNPGPLVGDSFFDVFCDIDLGGKELNTNSFFDVFTELNQPEISEDSQSHSIRFGNAPIVEVLGGTFVPTSGESDDTDSAIALGDTIINIPVPGGVSSVVIPDGTVITASDDSSFDISSLTGSSVDPSLLAGLGEGVVVDGALQWGIMNLGLQFNPAITLNIFVGNSFNGQTLNVLRSVSGAGDWTSDGIVPPATCLVSGGLCTFQTTKASVFAATSSSSGFVPVVAQGGGGFFGASSPSSSNVSVAIAEGGKTSSSNITLNLTYGLDIVQMAVSNFSDLSDASFEPVAPIRAWVLLAGEGVRTVYVKFRNSSGGTIVKSADIIVEALSASSSPEETSGGEAAQEGQVLGTTSEGGAAPGETSVVTEKEGRVAGEESAGEVLETSGEAVAENEASVSETPSAASDKDAVAPESVTTNSRQLVFGLVVLLALMAIGAFAWKLRKTNV